MSSIDSDSENLERPRSPLVRSRPIENFDLSEQASSFQRANFPNLPEQDILHLENNQINFQEMAEFKLEYLQIVPDFTGNQAILSEFIASAEQLINQFYIRNPENDFRNIYLLKSIKNKIKGDAANQIASYNVTTWNELKTALLATYSDKRDLQTLQIELCNMRQNSLKPLEFYTKIQKNLNLQSAYIQTHHADNSAILIEMAQKLALRSFLKHLNNPLGDYLSTRKPDSLNEALNILTNDFNLNDRTSQFFKQNQKSPGMATNRPSFNSFNSTPAITYPSQKQSQAAPSNVFKPRNNYVPTNRPQPMSTQTSRNSAQTSNYFRGNSRPQNKFIAEELHNLEQDNVEISEIEDENLESYENLDSNDFFYETASEPNS